MIHLPNIMMGSTGNVFTRVMHFENIGDTEPCHTHQYNHATLVAHGSVRVIANNQETVFSAPHLIWMHKDVAHTLIALEPNTVCACIHALRGENGEIIDPESVPNGVRYQTF